jgi:hypothetical protein
MLRGSLWAMGVISGGAKRRLRRTGGGVARRIAGRFGFDLVRSADGARTTIPDGLEAIPRGRTEPFATADYDVVPKGGFDIVRRDYYSPVPDLGSLPPDIWDRRSELGGIALDAGRAMEFVERELAPFIAELDARSDDPGVPGAFFLNNANYESVDAELLFAMVRWSRPRKVVELGSGFTTLLIADACRRNARDGAAVEHVAFDPYPRRHILGEHVPAPTRFEPVSATEVPLDVFRDLEAGDVLFVDTTHTVKLGSDVNFVILDVLPTLAPGVLVHFHDVFLPWEYPRVWFEEMRYLWAEQYLLQAFLAYNDAFEVVVPAQLLAREAPRRLSEVVPSFGPGVSPAALWIRRR